MLRRSLAVVTAALLLGACADGEVLSPSNPSLSSSTGPTLLECPVDTSTSVTATIDLLGGTLELDGHRVTIPANAVLLPTEFTLTVPASNYLKVSVTAAGEEHFEFLEPVSLTLSYERCSRSNIDKADLTVWYVSSSDVLLENMGGTDDKVAREVTTTTDHLSDYALGTP